MNDTDDLRFLLYCSLHSQTDLALFSVGDCRRLFALAGENFPYSRLPDSAFRTMYPDLVQPLITRAQNKIGAAR